MSSDNTKLESIIPQKGLVFIVVDCYYYTAGEKVTGEILVNVPDNYPPSKLIFRSKGLEEVQLQDPKGLNRSASSSIFTLENNVGNWEGGLQEGQYVFPFTFKLPQFAPASFSYIGEDSKGRVVKAQVFYEMSLSLEVPSNPNLSLSHSRGFTVRNKNTRTKPSACLELNEGIAGCCCASKGSTIYKLQVTGEDHTQVGGVLKYKLQPNNSNCSASIYKIATQIKFKLHFKLENENITIDKLIENEARPTWIGPHSNLVFDKDFEFFTRVSTDAGDNNPGSNSSPLIYSEYLIEFYMYYDILCKKDPLVLKMPVHVNPATNYIREEPVLPRPWEPLESPILVFTTNH